MLIKIELEQLSLPFTLSMRGSWSGAGGHGQPPVSFLSRLILAFAPLALNFKFFQARCSWQTSLLLSVVVALNSAVKLAHTLLFCVVAKESVFLHSRTDLNLAWLIKPTNRLSSTSVKFLPLFDSFEFDIPLCNAIQKMLQKVQCDMVSIWIRPN